MEATTRVVWSDEMVSAPAALLVLSWRIRFRIENTAMCASRFVTGKNLSAAPTIGEFRAACGTGWCIL
jgi:hypothetical protein